jgi:cell division protein FtsN
MSDQPFREIQLSAKQLWFLFMSAVVLAVVIFLLGVSVGRGVRDAAPASTAADAGVPGDTLVGTVPGAPAPDVLGAAGGQVKPGATDLTYDSVLRGVPPGQAGAAGGGALVEQLTDAKAEAKAETKVESKAETRAGAPADRGIAAPAAAAKAPDGKAAPPAPVNEVPPIVPPARTASSPATKAPEAVKDAGKAARSTPPAAKGDPPAPPPVAPPSGWRVQINAFNSRENAERNVASLKAQSFVARVVENSGPGPRFLVVMGPYADRAEADLVASRLSKEGIKSRVTR